MSESQYIRPTVGRIVWYHGLNPGLKTEAALITRINSLGYEPRVNLTIFCFDGETCPMLNVPLVQPGYDHPPTGHWCEWMPYQVKKGFGSESGEKAAGEAVV